jgi:hemin uptake protein HemP
MVKRTMTDAHDKPAPGVKTGCGSCGSCRTPARVRSDDLLGRHGELVIEHGGKEYRLRVTRNGKLILTA